MSNDDDSGLECNCDKCPLNDNPCNLGPVPDDGGDYTILVVGEAPGEDEDKEGTPFIGRSGQLLRSTLTALGYPEDKVTFTNVVRCRPPDNKIAAKYINCCYTGIPIKDNTVLVLLLGNTPLKAVLGETGISQWNGVRVERDGVVYAPAFHPAYFLYSHSADAMDAWLEALDDALTVYTDGMADRADARITYEYPSRYRDISAMCDQLMAADMIAFDSEVADLDPFHPDNRVLALSFCDGKMAWAFLVDHPMSPESEWIDDLSLDLVLGVLSSHPRIIGHNIKFDQMMMSHMLDCEFDAFQDTMLMSFMADSRHGIHGLKRLAGFYLGMFEYDSELDAYKRDHKDADYERGGSYANIPAEVLLPYAAMDAAATWLLYRALIVKLTDAQITLMEQLTIPASNALARMQLNGMAVDRDVADRYRRLYGQIQWQLERQIARDECVQRFVNERYAQYQEDHPKGTLPKYRFAFNPGSSQQKCAVLYERQDGYKLKPLGTTDTGAPSCKREWLAPYREQVPLVDWIIMHSMMSKMLSTYILPIATGSKLSGDGRARSSFNQHIVATGRLSSSRISPSIGFNQQNIPVPEKEPDTVLAYQPIKNMFTHTWDGGAIMSVDYSGMELRVFASLAECEAMLEIHRSGKDFHTMVAVMASGMSEEEITKPIRYRYKWTNWTLLYGGDEYTLHRMYGIPLEDGKATIATYYERFPEVPLYKDACVQFARHHGYIETPFGNRRPLPDIHAPESGRRHKAERAAVNTPVQGAAGKITIMALVIIDRMMTEAGFKSMLVNTVHDSIVTDVYPGEQDRVAALQVDVMENVISYAKVFMPDIDMTWLICPLRADVEVGSHYGTMGHKQPSAEALAWAAQMRQEVVDGG